MKHNHISFTLRLPPELKEQLDAAAGENMRSIHAEILTRLAQSFTPSLAQLDAFTDGDLVRALMNRYERGDILIQILPGRGSDS
jgi:predicted transcriptional regulator